MNLKIQTGIAIKMQPIDAKEFSFENRLILMIWELKVLSSMLFYYKSEFRCYKNESISSIYS